MIPLYSPPPSNHHTVAHIYESLKIYLNIKRSTRPEPNLSRGSWKREITALLPNASLTSWLCLGRVCLYPWNIWKYLVLLIYLANITQLGCEYYSQFLIYLSHLVLITYLRGGSLLFRFHTWGNLAQRS